MFQYGNVPMSEQANYRPFIGNLVDYKTGKLTECSL